MSASTLNNLAGYKPSDFGLNEYAAYRTHPETGDEVQLEVIEHLAYTEKRFGVAAAPVGVGKSLVSLTLAKLTGLRTAIVVPYKGLQDQYARVFPNHLVDIRGRANYDCGDYAHLSCKGGLSMGCRYANGNGCEYEVKKANAKNAQVVLTNYDYFLNVNDHAGGLKRNKDEADLFGDNPVEMLILDEGDEAADKVADYLGVKVSENDIRRFVDPRDMSDKITDWHTMIDECKVLKVLEDEIRTTGMEIAHVGRKVTKQQVEELHRLERLQQTMTRIRGIKDDWVLDAQIGTRYGRQWSFDVVWPGRYTEQYLFCGIPKVVIMSGTLTLKDMALLGVRKEEFDYRQWARIFPAVRQPIYVCPPRRKDEKTGELRAVMVQKNTSEDAKRFWVEWQDKIIDGRLDRKGLILTSSYEYARYLMQYSRHSELMVGNTNDPDSESASEVAERFYLMDAPRILISPSFGRGWNFEFSRAEYVIVPKCPFVPMQSKVMQARLERDELYGNHLTMKKVEQACGRIMRDTMDQGECFLSDGHFTYFIKNNRTLAQRWFADAARTVIEIPDAPEKLALK